MIKRTSLDVVKNGDEIYNREAWSDGSVIWYDRYGEKLTGYLSSFLEGEFRVTFLEK